MKKIPLLLCFLFSLMTFLCQGQTTLGSSDYSITNWQNGKQSATVMTFDDWSPGHKAIVAPTLVTKGIQATFYIVTNNIWNSSEYDIMNNAVSNGCEIADHTVTHPDLTTKNATELATEVETPITLLNANVTGQHVNTFAYPFGSYNTTVIAEVKRNLISARTVNRPSGDHWVYDFAQTIDDYYKLSTVSIDPTYQVSDLGNDIQAGIADGGLITFLIHSVYNADVDDHWFNPLNETRLDSLLNKLQTYKNQTWITTMSNAICYHKERASSSLTLVSDNATTKTIVLSDTLSNNNLYRIPLTLKLHKAPTDYYSSITQNETALAFSYTSTQDSVIFNATPDEGEIVLTKSAVLSTKSALANSLQLWPTPTKDLLNIQGQHLQGTYHFIISDLQGKTIQSGKVTASGSDQCVINLEGIPAGLYTFILQNDADSLSQKLLIAR